MTLSVTKQAGVARIVSNDARESSDDDAHEMRDDGLDGEVSAFASHSHMVHSRGIDHHRAHAIAAPQKHDGDGHEKGGRVLHGQKNKTQCRKKHHEGKGSAHALIAITAHPDASGVCHDEGCTSAHDATQKTDFFHRIMQIDHKRFEDRHYAQ